MSKAAKEMRLVCRQLLHLHFCARGFNLWCSLPPGEKKSKEQEKIHLQSLWGTVSGTRAKDLTELCFIHGISPCIGIGESMCCREQSVFL